MPFKSVFFLFVIVICLVLLGSYAFTGDLKFWEIITLGIKSGSLQIQGAATNVTRIFINQTILTGPCDPLTSAGSVNCFATGSPNTTRRINVTVEILRNTGDCDDTSSVKLFFFFCNDTVANCPINPATSPANYTIPEIAWTLNGPKSSDNLYCNYTGYFDIWFWNHYGNWTINVSAYVQGSTPFLSNFTVRKWKYVEFNSLDYPFVTGKGGQGLIPLGVVSANAWNYGVGQNRSVNTGNIRLNVSYNTTNFTGPTGCTPSVDCNWIDVHGSGGNFSIQNVSNNLFILPLVSLEYYKNMTNDTSCGGVSGCGAQYPQWFFPRGGVRRCGDNLCLSDDEGQDSRTGTQTNKANYTLYWSINVPAISSGIYTNDIYVNSFYYYPG